MNELDHYKPPESAAPSAGHANFIAGGRKVDAGRGWEWIVEGWKLFTRQPLLWIVEGFIFSLVILVLPYTPPVLGSIASMLVTPVFVGGLMLGSRAVQQGQTLTFGHLFAGFQKNVGALLSGGLIWLVSFALISLTSGLLIGTGVVRAIGAAMNTGDFVLIMQIVMGAMMAILLGLLVATALLVPVVMMFWFAPALIVMQDAGIGAALKMSFTACLKNVVPFFVYSVVLMVLSMIATIPIGLGYLVLVPVILISIYTAYRDIFFAD